MAEPRDETPQAPFFSVVIPVLDGGEDFGRCLEALRGSGFADWELIVADDGSVDASGDRARAAGANVIESGMTLGPAGARNLAAREAKGQFLFFLDADCVVHPDTLERAAEVLRAHPEVDAVFGSYDDRPSARGAVSQFKNLFHHWVHQRGAGEAATFWAGCGAIRRSVFEKLGGFDAELFRRPAIEDIELGYRMRDAGHRILLAADVQVCHLKRWTLGRLVLTDVFQRGVPWTRLLAGRQGARELNVGFRQRLSVALVLLLAAALVWGAFDTLGLWISLALAATVVALNRDLYRFFATRRGVGFLLAAVPLHFLYCAYSGIAFALGRLSALART